MFPFSQVRIQPKKKISDINLESCSSSCNFLRTEEEMQVLMVVTSYQNCTHAYFQIQSSVPVRAEMVAVDGQNFSHGKLFSYDSSCFTVNCIIFSFLVLRGLGNYSNSRVPVSQILMRPSQGVQKDPIFIFKISQILNKSLNI